jgi:SRSO17 transposase
MTLKQIAALRRKLSEFLSRFTGCFGRVECRGTFRCYVQGQLSEIQRKNCEAIALVSRSRCHPRTLQRFLESMCWNEEQLRDRCQQIVAEEHRHPEAIGCVDESGVTKSGQHTVGADRQYNGSRGKLDNCVVAVHLSYAAPGFHVLLDSRVYVTKSYAANRARRRENHVPDDVVFRTKPQLAADLIRRALHNGIRVSAWTFDAGYGRDGAFLNALENLQQAFVAEVPANFYGWIQRPVRRRVPVTFRTRGRHGKQVPVRKPPRPRTVANLVRYAADFQLLSWQRYRIKDTHGGPEVWEVKWIKFWRKVPHELASRRHCLIVARNVLTGEVKYFVANRCPGQGGVTLRWLLQVAFGRWNVEACFREAKEELGMDHYEVRGWRCVHRHFYVTQLSHLFCAIIRQQFDQPTEDGFHVLTMEQVRRAVNVSLAASHLTSEARTEAYQAESDRQAYHHERNVVARRSHTKTRLQRLLALQIDPDRIKSCLNAHPPSSHN